MAAVATGLLLWLGAAWQPWSDPLSALPRARGASLAAAEEVGGRDGRTLRHMRLHDPELGEIGLAVSLPDPLPARPLPVLFLLGGLGPGLKTIAQAPPVGDNVIIAYDWPLPRKLPRGVELLRQVPALCRLVFLIPGQIAAAAEWAVAQPWADTRRVSLLGFSLGALAAPAAQRLIESDGGRIGWTVLAYGGADLATLMSSHPHFRPDWAKPLVRSLGGLLLWPVDPAAHLPHLSGRFLVIGGRNDGLVPEASAQRMREATPEPKTVVLLDGEHMGTGRDERALFEEILEVTKRWLTENGAVVPF